MTRIVVAPFSNSDIRDWPGAHYAALIGRLLDARPDAAINVIGTRSQRIAARDIVRAFDPARVRNACGRLAWDAAVDLVRHADGVAGNNSGIAHLAAFHAVPTLCLFGGAHQRLEWRPIGPRVVTLSRAIACSPCNLHHRRACPYDLACLRDITPAEAADALLTAMDETSPRHADDGMEARHG